MQPDPRNHEPRIESPGHLGSWFPGAWVHFTSICDVDLNAHGLEVAYVRCLPLQKGVMLKHIVPGCLHMVFDLKNGGTLESYCFCKYVYIHPYVASTWFLS